MKPEILYGLAPILVGIAMLWIAKPAKGQDAVPWLRVFVVGQLYVLSAMACMVVGVSVILTYWS